MVCQPPSRDRPRGFWHVLIPACLLSVTAGGAIASRNWSFLPTALAIFAVCCLISLVALLTLILRNPR
jgi:hypothetical protein